MISICEVEHSSAHLDYDLQRGTEHCHGRRLNNRLGEVGSKVYSLLPPEFQSEGVHCILATSGAENHLAMIVPVDTPFRDTTDYPGWISKNRDPLRGIICQSGPMECNG